MSIAIILGDPHIGGSMNIGKAGIGSALNSRVVDQSNLLDWVLDKAIDLNADKIIVTGDVFEDPKPHTELIVLFISWINKCAIHNINVEVIMGNHDMLRTGNNYISPLDIISESNLPNCSIHKNPKTIYMDNVAFTFLPFRDRKSFSVESNVEATALLKNIVSYELASIPLPFTKVLVGHLALDGAIFVGDEVDDLVNELFCAPDMFEGYDYVWMGHVHKPQVMQKSPYIAHVGSMDISNFGETDHKKNIVVFDTELKTHYTMDLPTRGLSKISIIVPKDTVDTTKYVLDEIKKLNNLDDKIIKLEVSLSDPELKSMNRSEVEKLLYSEGVFNIAGFSESKKISLIKKDLLSSDNLDATMDVPAAIKLWAKNKWSDDSDSKKSKFIESAIEMYNDYRNGAKN